MLPGQIIAGQLLQGGTSLPTATPTPLATPGNSSIPLDSPDRSCGARTLGHSPSLLAELGFPAGRDVVYAHRRSGAVSEAAMRACCAPSALASADAFCLLWCALPARFAAQMRTPDGDFITAPFVSCLEHVYFAEAARNGTLGSGNGTVTVQQEDDADEVFGPVAVRPAEETSGAAAGARREGEARLVCSLGISIEGFDFNVARS
ncbi:hypothetical protein F4809DRAFT_641099 [Biscogniauxia mediterranea]|nr:hypothetical protein F4809DRAFT_641099 [Biscogniauxia mediterranea]